MRIVSVQLADDNAVYPVVTIARRLGSVKLQAKIVSATTQRWITVKVTDAIAIHEMILDLSEAIGQPYGAIELFVAPMIDQK